MEIDENTLHKLASQTADFVRNSAQRISELESELEEKNTLLAKKAQDSATDKIELVKIAVDQSEVEKVVDGLVKIAFVDPGERDQVVKSYMENPSEILGLAASFVLPLAGEGMSGGGQHIDKQATEHRRTGGAAVQRPDRPISEILRSVKRETSETR